MKTRIKLILEHLAGHRLWIERPSKDQEVRSFIRTLRPVSTYAPLIRVGGNNDGGYLIPDDLEGISNAVSPGISTEISFDTEIANRGINVFMADGSVKGPPTHHPLFTFHKSYIDVIDDDHNMRLDTFCSKIEPPDEGDRLLQMDIEGAEYRVILDTSDSTIKRFRIMVVEFHSLDQLYSDFSFNIIKATFQKILRTHCVVHIHPNNCAKPQRRRSLSIPPVMEFTFYRKDRAKILSNQMLQFPHQLDCDNLPNSPGVVLPRCWY